MKSYKFKFMIYPLLKIIPTKLYIKTHIFLKTKKVVNFRTPKTFIDKVNYLKLDNSKIMTEFADKLKAKSIITTNHKDLSVASVLWEGYKLDQGTVSKLPKKFVIKSNHFSGDVIVVNNKDELNIEEVNKYYAKILKKNYYYFAREICYKNIEPKLFIEEYLGTEDEMTDYKFFCFNGKFEFCHIVEDRFTELKDFMVDKDYNNLNFNLDTRSLILNKNPKKTEMYKEMIKLAEHLSKPFDFVRVDFYIVNQKIYFGELTFFPWGGAFRILPESRKNEIDSYYGKKLELSSKKEGE